MVISCIALLLKSSTRHIYHEAWVATSRTLQYCESPEVDPGTSGFDFPRQPLIEVPYCYPWTHMYIGELLSVTTL